MKTCTKGIMWGLALGASIIVLSYPLAGLLCSDFNRVGPAYPTDQPLRALVWNNPLRSHAPFPRILFPWVVWLVVTGVLGWTIGTFKGRTHRG